MKKAMVLVVVFLMAAFLVDVSFAGMVNSKRGGNRPTGRSVYKKKGARTTTTYATPAPAKSSATNDWMKTPKTKAEEMKDEAMKANEKRY